uniref:Uncharacterized protein n=1 Tax=Oryza glaberrima TaxID=4538 RepID=I1PN40_ORYGL
MHLWPSLRIRDSFKHAYLDKLEFNLARMKRARGEDQDQDQQQPPGDGKAPLLEGLRAPRSSFVAGALELAMDAAMLLTCCCCCFCCGVFLNALKYFHLYFYLNQTEQNHVIDYDCDSS